MGTENLLMCRAQACQPSPVRRRRRRCRLRRPPGPERCGMEEEGLGQLASGPQRLLAVRGQRGAHGSASLFAFLPEGRSGPTLNFSGGLFRVSGVPGPWTPPARPPSRLDAGGPETALHTPSQLGRAECRAGKGGQGRRDPGTAPGGAGAPGARAVLGQGGGSWCLRIRAERRCR